MMVSGAVVHSLPAGYRFDLRARALLPLPEPEARRGARRRETAQRRLRRVSREIALEGADSFSVERRSPYGSYWYRAVACILLSGRIQAKVNGDPNMTDVNRLGKEASFNPYFIERVGAQKPQTVLAAVLAVVFRETLPEPDGGFRIVSGAGHVNQAEMIRLGFLQAAVGQLATHLCNDTVGRDQSGVHTSVAFRQTRIHHSAAKL